MYTEGHTVKNARKLPLNLLDACASPIKARSLRDAFGNATIDSYIKLKTDEWNSYSKHLSSWERDHTLDC